MDLNEEKPYYVRSMFARIADRYDLMNKLMTFGQDNSWRREMIARAALKSEEVILDLGTGTGDIAREAKQACPSCFVVAGDFTVTMMRVGQSAPKNYGINWCGCDAQDLPFPDASFDVVFSGFLFRNVSDIRRALAEQLRVLTPGGRFITLDTTPPKSDIIQPAIHLYEQRIIPLLGKWVSGDEAAYRYLPASTAGFLSAEKFAAEIFNAGFKNVGFVRKMFGTVAIHWGMKTFPA